ncbi:MAG: CPBP family intramembrane metalloprotease [Flavobacterium sp.]|uniref:CPBP family glutamic-type intramembrane protease n=1 Tax=Flavobacterium sp. TaxID=239 RepID=UPI001B1F47FC|nr:CPBP family glutamic-type intramembrane protease [Flavobacterium sp.]MBO9582930.1 CPBP family intramembrane metalloprotease [Flavobacterium sp.]
MFKIFKSDIKDILVCPRNIVYVGFFRKSLFYYFIAFTLMLILFSFFIGILVHEFSNKSEVVIPKNITFFKVAIISPIMEEILFRLLIIKNKYNLVLFSVFFLISFLYEKFVLSTVLYYVFNISFLLLFVSKKFNYKLNISDDKSLMLPIIYFSCLLFGVFHLSNFNNLNTLNIVIVLYIFSKIISGFIFSLLRLKFGIAASIALHIFLNSFSYILIS